MVRIISQRSRPACFVRSFDSNSSVLTCGAPQGTVLGPILFTLYTAPLEDILFRYGTKFMLFADDTQIYIKLCENIELGRDSIESCVDEIRTWMQWNLLVLNDTKIEVIHFKSKFFAVDSNLSSLFVYLKFHLLLLFEISVFILVMMDS